MPIRFLTAGESHGKALMGILEGIPSGIPLCREDIELQLRRRKRGYGRGSRQKIETEEVEIIGGVFNGLTTGAPLGIYLPNNDYKNWDKVVGAESSLLDQKKVLAKAVFVPRPGHADFIGGVKYRHQDRRIVLERASARETAMRMALSTVALKFLSALGVNILSRVVSIGKVSDRSSFDKWQKKLDLDAMQLYLDQSLLRVLDTKAEKSMIQQIDLARQKGDTLGGSFELRAQGLVRGLGSYVHWDRRLGSSLSKAIMGLNAIKALEIGEAIQNSRKWGSSAHDELFLNAQKNEIGYKTNRSGGIVGGMTTGKDILLKAYMKPISTTMKPLKSVNVKSLKEEMSYIERSDYCAVTSAAVIGEGILALELMQAYLEKFGGDHLDEIKERVNLCN